MSEKKSTHETPPPGILQARSERPQVTRQVLGVLESRTRHPEQGQTSTPVPPNHARPARSGSIITRGHRGMGRRGGLVCGDQAGKGGARPHSHPDCRTGTWLTAPR